MSKLPTASEALASVYTDLPFGHDLGRFKPYVIQAIESLESAILAEGYGFENKLTNPEKFCYFSRDRMIEDVKEWHEAQSRTLPIERTLILEKI